MLNRASSGIVIPHGVELVSWGSYISAKLFGGNDECAEKLDFLFSRMDASSVRRLSSEITTSVGDIVSSYNHLRSFPELQIRDKDEVAKVGAVKNYNTYVSSVSIKKITMMKALSCLPENKKSHSLDFIFDDGVLKAKVGDKSLYIPEAKKHCKEVLENEGIKVDIKIDSIMENVAIKAFPGNASAVREFMDDNSKVLAGVSLKDSASLLRNGKMTGKIGAQLKNMPMSDELTSYLTSASGLQANFINSEGKNLSGIEIVNGAEFISGASDLYRLGVNNKITEAILSSQGVNKIPLDIDARLNFVDSIAKFNPSSETKVVIPFNFSWLAEEFKKVKGNPKSFEEFKEKYDVLFKSTPYYCGGGSFKYFLILGDRPKSIVAANYFKIPKVVDKFIGHYNIMASFYPNVSLGEMLDLFFVRNRSVLGPLVKSIFKYYCSTYFISLAKHGGVTTTGWDDEEDSSVSGDNDDTIIDYVTYVDDSSIEMIKGNSYGYDSRMSSDSGFKPQKKVDTVVNSNLQRVADSLNSNISPAKEKVKDYLKYFESVHAKFSNGYYFDDKEAIDVHICLGAAIFVVCPERITENLARIIRTKAVMGKFKGTFEKKFRNLVAMVELDEFSDDLYNVVADTVNDTVSWIDD